MCKAKPAISAHTPVKKMGEKVLFTKVKTFPKFDDVAKLGDFPPVTLSTKAARPLDDLDTSGPTYPRNIH